MPRPDSDRDDSNPVDLTSDEWAELFADAGRLGEPFEDYLDHDHSMDF